MSKPDDDLRDQFAAAAFAGLIARQGANANPAEAYDLAVALLDERKRRIADEGARRKAEAEAAREREKNAPPPNLGQKLRGRPRKGALSDW